MSVKLESGKRYEPKNDDPVHCILHDVTVKWGDLDGIQKTAVEEGIDVADDLPCILLPSRPASQEPQHAR